MLIKQTSGGKFANQCQVEGEKGFLIYHLIRLLLNVRISSASIFISCPLIGLPRVLRFIGIVDIVGAQEKRWAGKEKSEIKYKLFFIDILFKVHINQSGLKSIAYLYDLVNWPE